MSRTDQPGTGPPLRDLPFDELRAARWATRREHEIARLQARPNAAGLGDRLRELTDELISRYTVDPSLIDELLFPACAVKPERP